MTRCARRCIFCGSSAIWPSNRRAPPRRPRSGPAPCIRSRPPCSSSAGATSIPRCSRTNRPRMAEPAAAKILVADDDQSLVRTLSWILKENGYDVVTAPGGEGLLDKLEAERPNLLLLDIMMPKVDGLQLLAKLKADDRFRDVPVLMISSMPPEEATVKALGLGAADFISKPFRVRELLARVKAHIRSAQELARARDEAQSRAAIVDILHEVTDSLKPDEIYHILVRRVARVLQISKCSMVLAKPGDQLGVVVAAYENPMLRNLQIELARYPEIQRALTTSRSVLVEDVNADPLYHEERVRWQREQITVPTRSAVALPFSMKDQQLGVFFLRTTGEDPPLTRADAGFAETVIRTAVAAIEKAYDFETAVSDKKRLEKLAATNASPAPTVSWPSRTKPSIARRTKGATWCVNERTPLSQMRDRVCRQRPILPPRRQHAGGGAGEARDTPAPLRVSLRRRHRRPYAPASEAGSRPRLLPLGRGARLA